MAPADSLIYGTEPRADQIPMIEELRLEIVNCDEYKKHEDLAEAYLTDQVLHRFLCARNYNKKKSFNMLRKHLEWRFETYRPFEIKSSDVEPYALRGSVQVSPRGNDGYNRPVLILDDSKDNVHIKDVKMKQHEAMKHLVFNIERASSLLEDPVKRYMVFIHLEDFSLWTGPTLATTKETISILTHQYPERLGTCVLYRAPWVFKQLWEAAKPFIDKVTKEKIFFVSGSVAEGSKNDLKLKELMGDNWRHVAGVDLPAYEKGGSKGYKHSEYWKMVQEDEKRFAEAAKKQQLESLSATIDPGANEEEEVGVEREVKEL